MGDGTSPTVVSDDYFFAQLFDVADQVPPAFSQSASVVYCEKSPDVAPLLGDGLADGEAPEPLGDAAPLPEVLPPPLLDPAAPELPEGAPEPEPLPDAPLLDWARTSAGVRSMTATRMRARKCFM